MDITSGASIFLLIFTFLKLTLQDLSKLKQHLYEYEYIHSLNVDADILEDSIRKFQTAHGLIPTGVSDEETQKKLLLPRCGKPARVSVPSEKAAKWHKRNLTYKLYNWTEPFTKTQLDKIIENLIYSWTQNVNLALSKSTSSKVDIEMYFTVQDDLDGALGYAFFPPNGDIFFDSVENWTLDEQTNYTNLTYFGWVAAHELGHALGLPHAETNESVMFPYYNTLLTGPSTLDLEHLQNLYGEAVLKTDLLCRGNSTNALLNFYDSMIIQGRYYWKLSEERVVGGPFLLNMTFAEIIDKVDAAFAIKSTLYFIEGAKFYKYIPNRRKPIIKKIAAAFDNLTSPIDAAFYEVHNKTIYFFKGTKYFMLDTRKPPNHRLTIGNNTISKDWKGLPDHIDAAEALSDDTILFIKGDRCYAVNISTKEAVRDEPCRTTYFMC